MRFIYLIPILFSLNISLHAQKNQNFKSLDSINYDNLPSLNYFSFSNPFIKHGNLDLIYNIDFSSIRSNKSKDDIKEGFFTISKYNLKNLDSFTYEAFQSQPADLLRSINPNYDLMSLPLPSH